MYFPLTTLFQNEMALLDFLCSGSSGENTDLIYVAKAQHYNPTGVKAIIKYKNRVTSMTTH